MTDKNLEQAAEELSIILPDAIVADEKVVIFEYHEKLSPEVLEILAKHDLSLKTTGMIEYTHKEKTVLGNSQSKMKATFIAV